MSDWQRRGAYAAAAVAALVLTYAAGYQWAMRAFEGEAVSYVQALQVVAESITTAGFGGHAPWESAAMNLMVLAMNLTGVLLVFLAVPLFAVPLLREGLRTRPPEHTDWAGHVIICHHSPRGDAFARGLAARGQPYVFVEPDRERAQALHENGHDVIAGNPELTRTLRRANLPEAVGVVADAGDDTNASIALSVRELAPEVRLVTLVEDPARKPYHRLAGADAVLSPRQILGRSLARQVPTVLMKEAAREGVKIDEHLGLFEIKIEPGSALCQMPLREAHLRERFGVDALGAWKDGEFTSPVMPDARLEAGTRLLVSGEPTRLQALQEEAVGTARRFGGRAVVVAGYGRAGEVAASALEEASTPAVVLDRESKEGVDVVGDVRDRSTLEEAGIAEAKAAIVAVDDDTTAIFATLVMRDLNPDCYLIVRANREEDEQKLYRAGADYVQSLATVSGRMMASRLLSGEEVLTPESQIEVAWHPAGTLAGQTLAGADLRRRTGATVLAALREGEVLAELGPDSFRFDEGDEVLVAGTSESVRRFEAECLG